MPKFLRPALSVLVAALLASAALPAAAQAQTQWPTGPITIIQTFTAGSGVDVIMRSVQEPMQQALGVPLVMDYRPGAGGNVASELVSHARPDGYTLLLGTSATHGVNATLYKKLPFDVENDFTAIGVIADISNALTVNPDQLDVKTVREFIDKVKAAPGKYNYASTGNGTGTHLAFAEFLAKTNLQMVHIPYKGGPEALQGILKGDVCCIFNQVQTILPQYRAGKVRLLGVTTRTRVGVIPEVPTIAEAGVPGFESFIWTGLFAPKGLDPQLAAKINAAIRTALEVPAVRQKLIDLGNTPRAETVEQFRATVKADRAKWAAVVKQSGASID
jgi:tripartite-type tricarboxylate transporter receptor subunit TctC